MSKAKLILATLCLVLFIVAFSTATVQADSYKYDALNRLIEVTYDSGQKISYTYDAAGNIMSVTSEAAKEVLTGISLDVNEVSLNIGQTHTVIVKASYSDGRQNTITDGVVFTSSNRTVVKVDTTGKVTAVAAGEAEISASYGGKTATVKIKVLGADNTAPTKPTALTVSGRTETSISITWQPSKDDIAVKGYYIYRDSVKIASVTGTTYTNTGLVTGKGYYYSIKAYDAAGNLSEESEKIFTVTVVIPITSSNIKVQMYNTSKSEAANTINPRFKLINTGNTPIKLSDVKIRYYYTIDGEKPQNFWCDWSTIGSANVVGKFEKLSAAKEGADHYLEISFKDAAGTMAPGASVEVQTRLAKTDWTNYTQTGDYSFNSSASNYTDWTRIVGYIGSEVKWGAEPPDAKPIPVVEAIKIQMYNSTKTATSNTINPRFKIYNTGNKEIKLSDIKVRYYYTINGEKPQNFWCDWSTIGSANVVGKFEKLSTAKEGADYYLEISFKDAAGTIAPGTSVEVQTRFSKNDWTNYTQTGDYSFNSSSSGYGDWTKVTGYIGIEVKWGSEP